MSKTTAILDGEYPTPMPVIFVPCRKERVSRRSVAETVVKRLLQNQEFLQILQEIQT